jgi:ribonucleoside-diphosphate reductase alpha chain
MFEKKYSYKGETVKGAFERISNQLSQYALDLGYSREFIYNKFFDLMWEGFLAPSSPVLSNCGTNPSIGNVVSCSGQYIGDSVYDFYEGYKETALLSQKGFGTSAYLSDIRPRGSSISTGGNADGVVNVIDSLVDTSDKISQGNNRRGSVASYLDVEHGDFFEVAGYLAKNPGSAHIGWIIKDSFIKRLEEEDEKAIEIWNRILFLRSKFGKGYIVKTDTMNRLTTQAIKNSGLPILASNL